MPIYSSANEPALGAEMPALGRRWTLTDFQERHELVYGPGRIVPESWPERNVHSDAEAAQREGLPGPIASAPQLIALIHRQMLMTFGQGWLSGGTIDVKMIKPVEVNDLTTAKGRVKGIEIVPGDGGTERRKVICDVWVERLGGVKVMVGTASGLLSG